MLRNLVKIADSSERKLASLMRLGKMSSYSYRRNVYNQQKRLCSAMGIIMSWPSTEERKQHVWMRQGNVTFSQCHYFHTSYLLAMEQKMVPNELTETQYEALADETLDSLSEFFDDLPELTSCAQEYDSEFGGGVLTVHFNGKDGTYVLNKQTPNKQIWLSSPKTGPKRYDFCGNKWIYRHNGVGLHHLLEEEVSEILGTKISMKKCTHYS